MPPSKLLNSLSETTAYNRIADQSVERLAALSDGIFAVAMTLRVLDLRVPIFGMCEWGTRGKM